MRNYENSDIAESRMREAVNSGDTLRILQTMREMLAERFDRASPRDSAGLSRQIQIVTEHILKVEDGAQEDNDDFAKALQLFRDGL